MAVRVSSVLSFCGIFSEDRAKGEMFFVLKGSETLRYQGRKESRRTLKGGTDTTNLNKNIHSNFVFHLPPISQSVISPLNILSLARKFLPRSLHEIVRIF